MTSHTEGHSARPNGLTLSTPTYRVVTRTGIAVNGVLHVLVGIIALLVPATALLTPDVERVGALRAVASNPGGAVLFWVVAIGYVILGLWMLANLLLERHRDVAGRRRAIMIGRGIAYLALGAAAVSIAVAGRSSPQDETGALAGTVLQLPLGPVGTIVFALVTLAVAVYYGLKGWRRGYLDDIRLPASSSGRRPTILAGRVAYLGKSLALATVGILTLIAAFLPAGPAGHGGHLASLALSPFGPLALALIGFGLIAYGFYCAARARLARL
jgi:hypothetical protein